MPSPTSRLWPPASAVNQGSQACPGPVHLLLCVSQRGLLQFSPLCNDRSWADSMSSGAVCVGGKGQASQNVRAPTIAVCFSQAAPRRRVVPHASCCPSCYPSCCASCCVLCVVLCVMLRAVRLAERPSCMLASCRCFCCCGCRCRPWLAARPQRPCLVPRASGWFCGQGLCGGRRPACYPDACSATAWL